MMAPSPPTAEADSARSSRAVLLVVLIPQVMVSFLAQVIPVVAPVVAADLHWTPSLVGYFVATGHFGTISFLVLCTPFITRVGAVTCLLFGLVVGMTGILLLTVPHAGLPYLACFLIGFGYGPSIPAGTLLLQTSAPTRHRSLYFSIKQAGVPIGGMLAGICLPGMVAYAGWRMTFLAVAASTVFCAAAVHLLGRKVPIMETYRAGGRPISLFANLLAQVRAVRQITGMPRLASVGAFFAIAQSCWFAFLVVYLVARVGLSVSLAGLMFAAFQGASIVGRIFLGWLADRLGSAIPILRAGALAAAAASLALATVSDGWPAWQIMALSVFSGLTVAGWNGVLAAEVARLTPRHLLSEVASATAIISFCGYFAGPIAFAVVSATTGRLEAAFLLVSIASLTALALLLQPLRDVQPN